MLQRLTPPAQQLKRGYIMFKTKVKNMDAIASATFTPRHEGRGFSEQNLMEL